MSLSDDIGLSSTQRYHSSLSESYSIGSLGAGFAGAGLGGLMAYAGWSPATSALVAIGAGAIPAGGLGSLSWFHSQRYSDLEEFEEYVDALDEKMTDVIQGVAAI
jgi:hypothetical protein